MLEFLALALSAAAPGGTLNSPSSEATAPNVAGGVAGASVAADGALVFAPEYFAAYSPRTARDLVTRVPGFTADFGDSEVRGFAASGGNILIDGARPTTKSQSLFDLLGRIPAGDVERLELRRGGQGGEGGGQSALVNVVRRRTAGSGVYEAELEVNRLGRVTPRGEASYSGRSGATEYTFGLDRYMEAVPLEGERTIRDGAGALIARRRDLSPRTYREVAGTASFAAPLMGGVLRANLEAARWTFISALASDGLTPSGALTDSSAFDLEDRERSNEIGVDYERPFGPATLKLRALQSRRWFSNDERSVDADAAGLTTRRSAQRRRQAGIERLARVQLDAGLGAAHQLTVTLDGAQNVLEATFRSELDGVAQPPPPNADTVVEELRGDLAALHEWRIAPNWRVQTTVAGETSTLTQEQAAGRTERSFAFFKPSLQVARDLPGGAQARLKAERTVGQLDFGDFAATASFQDGQSSAGNAGLRPETAWRLEGVLDLRAGRRGALTATAYREWIEDVNDLVVVDGFDAPGNIGEGAVTGLELVGTLDLAALAPGLELTSEITLLDTEVTDPVTGLPRRASGRRHYVYEVELSQTLRGGAMAWGVEVAGQDEAVSYRVREEDTSAELPRVYAYLEFAAPAGSRLRAFAGNPTDRPFERERRFFTPQRGGSLSQVESRSRTFGPLWGVRLSGAF